MSFSKILRLLGFGTVLVASGVLLLGCGKSQPVWPEGKSPRLLTSFPPVYCFVANVAGDDAAVLTLLKTTGPHDYQPTPQDTLKVREADLFFINGLELDEHFANRLKGNSGNPRLPVIELGERVPNRIALGHEKEEKGAGDAHGHHHEHGEFDPHVWLGVPEAIAMVEVIRDELKKVDPPHADGYDRRAAAYVAKLKKIHDDGKAAFQGVKESDRKLIAFHDSLRYFARSFGIEVAGVMEMRAGIAPDPNEFRKLVETCKIKNVRVIAVEPQYSHEAADRLREGVVTAGGAGLRIVEIDPLETAQPEDFSAAHEGGKDFYERKMTENVNKLRDAWK